ncbi:hypothetical protein QBC35DRAFT_79050 [Podospora australis]|uniref:Uncharacterized protein n=1 Tax=Podospora australis TaxID=1536484 RepID=A0AAN6WY46_9PEZI|nr:hypothetical protein QBC35DRAFT_79050 [Podospora australis]
MPTQSIRPVKFISSPISFLVVVLVILPLMGEVAEVEERETRTLEGTIFPCVKTNRREDSISGREEIVSAKRRYVKERLQSIHKHSVSSFLSPTNLRFVLGARMDR